MKLGKTEGVKTMKEFKLTYLPRLTREESSSQSDQDNSYVKQLVEKTLKQLQR